MKKVLNYIGVDDWNNAKYQDENGRVYVDISYPADPREPKDLHTVSSNYGEPDTPVKFDAIEVTGWSDEDQMQKDYEFEYMMLSSLQMKACDPKAWGYTPQGLIEKMRHYYELLPVKPKWCTKEYIDNLEKNLVK